MFVSAFIYADDMTLLVPRSMTLKAMLNTSTDLAASHHFLTHQKLKVFILMMLAHNCRTPFSSWLEQVINLERRCAKFIWSCANSDNFIVKTFAKLAKCSSVLNFGDNYRYFSYICTHNKGYHKWDSPLFNLHKCFDSYISHSITVLSYIRDLC